MGNYGDGGMCLEYRHTDEALVRRSMRRALGACCRKPLTFSHLHYHSRAAHDTPTKLHDEGLRIRRQLRSFGKLLYDANQHLNLTSRKRTAVEVHEDVRSCLDALPAIDTAGSNTPG